MGAGLCHQPTSRGQRRDITSDAACKALSQWQPLGRNFKTSASYSGDVRSPAIAGVTDRVLAVLDVLATFHLADELCGERGLIAFPV